jgi:hypothetical protein
LSKAELARQVALAPEAVRRLFSVDSDRSDGTVDVAAGVLHDRGIEEVAAIGEQLLGHPDPVHEIEGMVRIRLVVGAELLVEVRGCTV